MSYINEPCGCSGGDSEYQSVINQSPILSGSQEATFSPQNNDFSFLETSDSLFSDNNAVIGSNNGINDYNDGGNNNSVGEGILNTGNSKNNFSQNDESKQNFSLDDIIKMSNKKSNNNIKEMNSMTQPNYEQNNSMMNTNNLNQMIPNINTRNGNSLPEVGQMRNMPQNVNPELQALMNNINTKAQLQKVNGNTDEEPKESTSRFVLKNFNIVLIVIIALAWSDVAKFYINRSIKFGKGNHKYYIYYAAIITALLYGTSKYITSLN
jgi:hypothetical protein